jgi:hypothetical protein
MFRRVFFRKGRRSLSPKIPIPRKGGIIAGQEHPDWLADKAYGTLRAKRDQLRLVLKSRITDHHRYMYMLRELMADLDRPEAKIMRLETE